MLFFHTNKARTGQENKVGTYITRYERQSMKTFKFVDFILMKSVLNAWCAFEGMVKLLTCYRLLQIHRSMHKM